MGSETYPIYADGTGLGETNLIDAIEDVLSDLNQQVFQVAAMVFPLLKVTPKESYFELESRQYTTWKEPLIDMIKHALAQDMHAANPKFKAEETRRLKKYPGPSEEEQELHIRKVMGQEANQIRQFYGLEEDEEDLFSNDEDDGKVER